MERRTERMEERWGETESKRGREEENGKKRREKTREIEK